MEKKKIVLVLYGFPGLTKDDPIREYLKLRNYEMVIPDLFDPKCEFNVECITDLINSELNDRKPEVIIAASLGGLVAPIFANKYPSAKLVMIATGPRVSTGLPIYNFIVKYGNLRIFRIVVAIVRFLPEWVPVLVYKIFNPAKNNIVVSIEFEKHIAEVLELFKRFSAQKLSEISLFVKNLDNSEALTLIKNQTLVLFGDNDLMMPEKLSRELKNLIPNSHYIFNKKRMHHNIFDRRDFKNVDKFLGD